MNENIEELRGSAVASRVGEWVEQGSGAEIVRHWVLLKRDDKHRSELRGADRTTNRVLGSPDAFRYQVFHGITPPPPPPHPPPQPTGGFRDKGYNVQALSQAAWIHSSAKSVGQRRSRNRPGPATRGDRTKVLRRICKHGIF